MDYKDANYWSLPENVRKALDLAKRNSSQSDFSKQLTQMNNKIGIYKNVFYTNQPIFEKQFHHRKRAHLEKQLTDEQKSFRKFMGLGPRHTKIEILKEAIRTKFIGAIRLMESNQISARSLREGEKTADQNYEKSEDSVRSLRSNLSKKY